MNRLLGSILLCLTLITSFNLASAQDLDTVRITLSIDKKPIREALKMLFDKAGGGKYRLSSEAEKAPAWPITATMTDVPFPTALKSLLAGVRMTYLLDNGTYVIDVRNDLTSRRLLANSAPRPGAKPITLNLSNRPLKEALNAIFSAAGLTYKIHPAIPAEYLARKTSVHSEGRNLASVLYELFESLKSETEYLVGWPGLGGYVILPSPSLISAASIDDVGVRLKIDSLPLHKALCMLFEKAEVNYLVVDAGLDKLVSLPYKRMPLSTAVRKLLDQDPRGRDILFVYDYGFARMAEWDGPPMSAARLEGLRVHGKLRDASAGHVIAALLQRTSRNFEIDRLVIGKITCELNGEGFRAALDKLMAAAKTIEPLRLQMDDGVYRIVVGGGPDKKP